MTQCMINIHDIFSFIQAYNLYVLTLDELADR